MVHRQHRRHGIGCSAGEAKSSRQSDTGCSHRTVADVSPVAGPATGVAVHDTCGASGWGDHGGTNASSPVVAAPRPSRAPTAKCVTDASRLPVR